MPSNVQYFDLTKHEWLATSDVDAYVEANPTSVVVLLLRSVDADELGKLVDNYTTDPPPVDNVPHRQLIKADTATLLSSVPGDGDYLAFNTDNNQIYYPNGGQWVPLNGDGEDPGGGLSNNGYGSGSAGTLIESFENTLGSFSCDTHITMGVFSFSDGGTPSNKTGAAQPHDGNEFLYLEASGVNYPNKMFCLCTDNFAKPTSMTFYYHMYGEDMGSLAVKVKQNDNTWKQIWIISGEQHQNKNSAWTQAVLDLTLEEVNEIKFEFTTGSSWLGDICLDDVRIVSVN